MSFYYYFTYTCCSSNSKQVLACFSLNPYPPDAAIKILQCRYYNNVVGISSPSHLEHMHLIYLFNMYTSTIDLLIRFTRLEMQIFVWGFTNFSVMPDTD